jgi:hypothetical protein
LLTLSGKDHRRSHAGGFSPISSRPSVPKGAIPAILTHEPNQELLPHFVCQWSLNTHRPSQELENITGNPSPGNPCRVPMVAEYASVKSRTLEYRWQSVAQPDAMNAVTVRDSIGHDDGPRHPDNRDHLAPGRGYGDGRPGYGRFS